MSVACRPSVERGQALIEIMLVVPILLALVMGTVDGARLLFASVRIEEATQEGALFAAYSPTDLDAIRERVVTSTNAEEVQDATVTVSCTTSPAPGSLVVTTEVDYPLVTPMVSAIFGSTIRLGASIVAPNLQGSC